MFYKNILIGAVLLFLSVFNLGCAQPLAVQTQVPHQCVKPTLRIGTNADLVQGLVELNTALELCNALNGVSPKE